jgi:hypothetical protein
MFAPPTSLHHRLAAGLLTATVMLAACGGSDDAGDVGTSPVTSPDTAVEVTAAPTTDGESSGSGIPDVIPGVPQACVELAQAVEGAFGGVDDMMTPGEPVEMFGDLAVAMEQLKGALPSEYSADLEVLANGYRALDDVLAEYDYDMMTAFSDPTALEKLQVLDDAEFNAAGERLSAYYEATCPTD